MDAYLPPTRPSAGRPAAPRTERSAPPRPERPESPRPERPESPRPERPARVDPLIDIVLRCTEPAPRTLEPPPDAALDRFVEASAKPRLRRSVLDAAKRLLSDRGPAITLLDVAEQSGVLQTAIRHEFAELDQLFAAILLDEIEALITDVAHRDLAEGLTRAAAAVSDSPLLDAFAGEHSGVLARLARVDVRSPGWAAAGQAVDAALARAGRRGTPTVLRWLASHVCAPATVDDIRADVDVLISGLPPLRADASWTPRRTG